MSHLANTRTEMHLGASLVLVFCLHATMLRAYCDSSGELTMGSPGRQPNSIENEDEHDLSNHRATILNQTTANGSTTTTPATSTTTTSAMVALNETTSSSIELDRFRLEFNKYKILSHLSITKNLDDIAPRIDEELRYKLLTSEALKESMRSDPATSSRRKRSLACDQVKNDKNACCLDNFYVNFTHIGWDKWILYPPGYQANYCRGKCDLSHARYYHSTLLSKYSHVVSLCCSPRQMAPLNLLYLTEDNKVHQRSIPDMVVESCDCA